MSDQHRRLGHAVARPPILFTAVALAAMLALAACAGVASSPSGGTGGSPAASASAAPSDGASPGASESVAASDSTGASPTADAPCSLVTVDDIAAVVGSEVTAAESDQALGRVCTFTATGDARGFATLTVFQPGGDVATTIADAIGNFGLGETSTPIGNEAAGTDGTIFVVTDDTLFAIVATDGALQPAPLSDLETVAKAIVERLGGENVAPSPSPSEEASPSPS